MPFVVIFRILVFKVPVVEVLLFEGFPFFSPGFGLSVFEVLGPGFRLCNFFVWFW